MKKLLLLGSISLMCGALALAQLTFSDLPFMARATVASASAPIFSPTNSDANIIGWWKMNLDTNAIGGSMGGALTDQSTFSHPLTNITGSPSFAPVRSSTNLDANAIAPSTNFQTTWALTAGTALSKNWWLPTSTNSELKRTVFFEGMSGWPVVFDFWARRATNGVGSTNVQILFIDSAAAVTTNNFTLTDTLTYYAATGKAAGSTFSVGWRDTNITGVRGTIEITNPSVRIVGFTNLWSTNYLATASAVAHPGTTLGSVMVGTGGNGSLMHTQSTAHSTNYSIYLVVQVPIGTAGKYIFDSSSARVPDSSSTDNGSLRANGVSGGNVDLKMQMGGLSITNKGQLSTNQFNVIACIFNGSSSVLQVNMNAPTNGLVGTPTNSYSLKLTDRSDGLQSLGVIGIKYAEVIIRNVADDGATRTNYISYLTNKYNISP